MLTIYFWQSCTIAYTLIPYRSLFADDPFVYGLPRPLTHDRRGNNTAHSGLNSRKVHPGWGALWVAISALSN